MFHEGEVKIQELSGSTEVARENSEMVSSVIHPHMIEFVRTREFVAVTTVQPGTGMVWSSVVWKVHGRDLLSKIKGSEIEIVIGVHLDDPLIENISQCGIEPAPFGILCINLSTRKRYRINGFIKKAKIIQNETRESLSVFCLTLETRENFFNCPKYIQKRIEYVTNGTASSISNEPAHVSNSLNDEQVAWLSSADTFFLGSYLPRNKAADMSHRGGNPGFVRVLSPKLLVMPDYFGNGMFMTLGNLIVSPKCSFAVVDFERRRILQMSGSGKIEFTNTTEGLDFTEKMLFFEIESVRQTNEIVPYQYRMVEQSPFNYPIVSEPPTLLPLANSKANLVATNSATKVQKLEDPIPLKISKVLPESPLAKTFELVPLFPNSKPPQYRAGQYGNFLVSAAGKPFPLKRTWTLSSEPDLQTGGAFSKNPNFPWSISITIKLKPGGEISTQAHTLWEEGDSPMALLGIGGEFSIFPDQNEGTNLQAWKGNNRVLALSGGAGITPMISMVRALAQIRGGSVDVAFVSAASSPEEFLFQEELQVLSQQFTSPGSRLQVTFCPSHPSKMVPWLGKFGRIDGKLLQENVSNLSDRQCFVCGPPSFMRDMIDLLLKLGVPPNQICKEDYDF